MIVRPARPEDEPDVYRLLCVLEEAEPPREEFGRVYRENLKDPDILYLVCERDGTAAAFASLQFQLLLHHCGRAAEIQELVVEPGLRGGGISGALFSAMRDEAKRRGCAVLEVCSNQKRADAHRFYEKCGMRRSHFKFTTEP